MTNYIRMLQDPMTKREQIIGVLRFYYDEDIMVSDLMKDDANPYTFQHQIKQCIVRCFLDGYTVGYRADVLRAAYKDFLMQTGDFPTISNDPDDGLYV